MSNTPAKVDRRVAILVKENLFGIVGIWANGTHNEVASYDPRCNPSVFQKHFNTRQDADFAFNDHVAISRDRGWNVVYNGQRNSG